MVKKVICPYCSYKDTKVIDSRENESYSNVRRRRECLKCEKRFTTYERCDLELSVIKRNGSKEPFNRDKMKMGMVKACSKRPINVEMLDRVTNAIETRLRGKGGEVKSEQIGKMVMNALKKMDKIAYIRYASVYHEFDDVKSFAQEAKLLMK